MAAGTAAAERVVEPAVEPAVETVVSEEREVVDSGVGQGVD